MIISIIYLCTSMQLNALTPGGDHVEVGERAERRPEHRPRVHRLDLYVVVG